MNPENINEAARNKFFPSWWLCPRGESVIKPFYRVICQSWDDYLLARRVKPQNIKAEIIYKPRTL